jgi:hypothetical protein
MGRGHGLLDGVGHERLEYFLRVWLPDTMRHGYLGEFRGISMGWVPVFALQPPPLQGNTRSLDGHHHFAFG